MYHRQDHSPFPSRKVALIMTDKQGGKVNYINSIAKHIIPNVHTRINTVNKCVFHMSSQSGVQPMSGA